jgi:hypothetical protein
MRLFGIGLAFFLTLACAVIRPASTPVPQSTPSPPGAPAVSTPLPALTTPVAPTHTGEPTQAPPLTQPSTTEMPLQPPYGASGGDSIGDPYIPELGNTGYQVDQYTLSLDISPQRNFLAASAVISATATLLDLGRISLDFVGFEVASVAVDGESAAFYRSPGKLYVDLPRAYSLDEPFTIQVDYHGQMEPQATPYFTDVKVGFNAPGVDRLFVFAEPDGARAWFPANDHPRDKAALRLEATVPAGFTAVSNGNLVETRPAGEQTTFVWQEEDPMATYLFTLAVGKYQLIEQPSVDGVQIRHYIYSDDIDAADADHGHARPRLSRAQRPQPGHGARGRPPLVRR